MRLLAAVAVDGRCDPLCCATCHRALSQIREADGLLQRIERREAGWRRLAAADVGRGRRRAAPGVLMPK